MRNATLICCLWPGLGRLWLRGYWSGLFYAVTFSVLLNFAILCSLYWTAWIGSNIQLTIWLALLAIWSTSAILSWRWIGRGLAPAGQEDALAVYREAQREYIRGSWFKAAEHLTTLLTRDPEDVDALLMLATLHRRTNRIDEAKNVLGELSRIERAEKWKLEIQQEYQQIERLEAEATLSFEKNMAA